MINSKITQGHDTTKSALSFCFYSIAKNPEIQRKCFEEIRDVLGDDWTRPASLSDLNSLKYLDLVIKETLRQFPTVPIIGRKATEETTIGEYELLFLFPMLNIILSVGNFTYPKGTDIILIPHLLTHNPKFFPNPLEFRPERFLEDETAEQSVFFSYIPFSAGPRNCIGQKYAVLEMKTLLAKVLSHFEISLAEDSQAFPSLVGEMILISENIIYFHMKPRIFQ